MKIITFIAISLITIVLNSAVLKFPIVTELMGLLFLLLVPGFLFIEIIGINSKSFDKLLYSIGISVSFIFLAGFFINSLHSFFGIKNAFDEFYVYLIFIITVFILLILYKVYAKNTYDLNIPNDPYKYINKYNLVLLIIPFFVLISVYSRNVYGNNVPLLFSIFIIALLPILVAYRKIPIDSYKLAVFVISFSLLMHTSLISNYLVGWDIQKEYYLANAVLKTGFWNVSLPDNYNAMLSITLFAPLISIFCRINLIWVFKVVYPFIFSFVPVILFRFFERQTDSRVAFFSVFFFMSVFVFFTELIALARQQIAELFLSLILLVMTDENIGKMEMSLLFVIFSFSLVVSHYGLSYVFILMLFMSLLMVMIRIPLSKLRIGGLGGHAIEISLNIPKVKNDVENDLNLVRFSFVALFFTFATTWYMYTSGSSIFVAIVGIGHQIISSIFTEFLNPSTAQGLAIISMESQSLLHEIGKYLHFLFQFLIIVGMFIFLRTKKFNFNIDYAFFSYVALIVCILAITLPYFSSALNTTRIYHITLFFLAPFAVIGSIYLSKTILKTEEHIFGCFSILLTVFILFNTGWIYTVSNDAPSVSSFAIDQRVDYPYFDYAELQGAKWIINKSGNKTVYADEYRRLIFLGYIPERTKVFDRNSDLSYVYLGKYNIKTSNLIVYKFIGVNPTLEKIPVLSLMNSTFEVYDNGESMILAGTTREG